MTQVVLGIDIASKSLGLALVRYGEPHTPLWADVLSIDNPDGGWLEEQIWWALGRVPHDIPSNSRPIGLELARVAIEDVPYVKSVDTLKKLQTVFALTEAACHRRWPSAPVVPMNNKAWKRDTVGNGNASKGDVRQWVMAVQAGHGVIDPAVQQDAIDAIAIAVAGAMVEIEEAG